MNKPIRWGMLTAISLGVFIGLQSSRCDTDSRPEAAGTTPITISMMPRRSIGPRAAFRVLVTVERDERNRRLDTSIDGGDYRRAYSEQLDGEGAARVRARVTESIPAGWYEVAAVLTRNDGSQHRVVTDACVMGMNESCDR